jgi:hypothetical protein
MQNAVRADLFLQSLALSVARNEVGAALPIAEVLKSEGLTQAEYTEIAKNPTFQTYLSNYSQELTDSGFSFEAKCRVLAEDLLPSFYHMARDVDIPAPVRAKVMENLVKWARLEPKTDVAVGSGAGFSINIVLPDASSNESTTTTIEIKPSNQPAPEKSESDAIDGEYAEITDDETLYTPQTPQITQEAKDLLADLFEEEADYEYAGDDVYE